MNSSRNDIDKGNILNMVPSPNTVPSKVLASFKREIVDVFQLSAEIFVSKLPPTQLRFGGV